MSEPESSFRTAGSLLFYSRTCASGVVKIVIRMDLVKCASTYPESRSNNTIAAFPDENPIPSCYFDDERFTGQDAVAAWKLYEEWLESTLKP
jgi:hypothetical protein